MLLASRFQFATPLTRASATQRTCASTPPTPAVRQQAIKPTQHALVSLQPLAALPQQCARRSVLARAGEAQGEDPLANYDEPESAQEANELGLKFTDAGRWNEALGFFEKAIKLPGTGTKRFRDKPRPASDRERMTSLYNIACCHSKLGDARSGLVALAGCLEAGYADYGQIRTDPDLEFLRKDERFEGLVQRYEPQRQGILDGFGLSSLFGGGDKK